MTTNGHYHNGKSLAAAVLDEPNLIRSNVRAIMATLDEHGAKGVPVDPKLVEALPIIAARLMQSENDRMKATGAKLVQAALRYNLDRFEIALHEARLAGGHATERHEVYDVHMPEARGRLGEPMED